MSDILADRVFRLKDDFLAAVGRGPEAIAVFNAQYAELRDELRSAAEAGTLPDHVRDAACANAACILDQAQRVRVLDARFTEISRSNDSPEFDSDIEALSPSLSPAASLPLFRYFLSNICFPYPTSSEKEVVAEAVRQAGWRDFDKKKFEDWLNRKRNQSGFVAILHAHCDNDREAMRLLCQTALFGAAAEKASLPADAVEDVEDMRDLLQSQHDELVEDGQPTWVDDLTSRIHSFLDERGIAADFTADPLSSDDDYSDSDDASSSSEASSTDVDEYEDDEPPLCVIGAKRKLADCDSSHRPLSRSPSVSSSASSSSTACSPRSFSGCSVSSVACDECEDPDADVAERPAKRSRNDSCLDAEPILSNGVPPTNTPLTDPRFTRYRIKRTPLGGGLHPRNCHTKRAHYAALGVASQHTTAFDIDLSSLSGICSLDWTLGEVILSDLDPESFTVDCAQPDDDEDNDEPEVLDRNHVESWSKLQIYNMHRMLLSHPDRSLPASLAQSVSYAFDVDTLGTQAIDLEEMMKLTPEALSAMFDTMNGLSPAPVQGATVPAAGIAVTSSEPVLLAFEAPVPSLDVPAPAPDAVASALDAPSLPLDVLESAAEPPALSVSTSAAALAVPSSTTEGPLGPSEDSPSPSSPSSSETDSTPALSDDSGSSSRSSSPEPTSEQDLLLMSPGRLSTHYSRLNEEVSPGKADLSQFQVDFGAIPEAITPDESSCASELLERYLNDPTIWA